MRNYEEPVKSSEWWCDTVILLKMKIDNDASRGALGILKYGHE